MPRKGKSYYIASQGPDDASLVAGVKWLYQEASTTSKPALVVVSQKQNLENIQWSQFAGLFAALKKQDECTVQAVRFALMTLRSRTWSWDGPALVIYGGQKLLDAVDALAGNIDVLYIPWSGNDGDGWIATWDAQKLGAQGEGGPRNTGTLPRVAEVALGRLTSLVNLSTGILHPSDHDQAIRTLETLLHKGELADPELVRQYLVRRGWQPAHAQEVGDLAAKLLDGRRPRGSTGSADERLWALWQERAEGNE